MLRTEIAYVLAHPYETASALLEACNKGNVREAVKS